MLKFDWTLLIIIIPIVIGFTGMIRLAKSANKFFRRADEIEEWIRLNESKEKVIEALFMLKEESFHKHTGNRLNELAKMAEIKYNIKLLK